MQINKEKKGKKMQKEKFLKIFINIFSKHKKKEQFQRSEITLNENYCRGSNPRPNGKKPEKPGL